ncbi:MAG: YcjF family protein [Xanthobacteraceae bacterium]
MDIETATAADVHDGLGPSATTGLTGPERDEAAAKLVEKFAMWSGAAGLIPLPVIDVAAVAGLQLQLVRRLSEMYNVAFAENRGKSIIASLMGSMIPATSGMGVASLLKSVPVLGTAIGTLTMSGVSAAATYAIGKVFIQHFASGGTLLDFDPPDYREFLKGQKDKWSSQTLHSSHSQEVAPPAQSSSGTGA